MVLMAKGSANGQVKSNGYELWRCAIRPSGQCDNDRSRWNVHVVDEQHPVLA